ncbi:protein phosphatase inhibitor 2-like isoform X2 [Sorex fumeus]|uniref:protein phosphatase inhibitor 2-like isoform X2 n=1 Tax=Sorex fumeus TaxID=62283 RepID=UPI0024ACB765|nr:protein phosphatase inhibitor 2-like isoform X2 [Sorex fumeus]
MEKPRSQGAAGGVSGESGVTRRVPGSVNLVDAGSGMASGEVLVQESGSSLHSEEISPTSCQSLVEVTALSSGSNQSLGEALGHHREPCTNCAHNPPFTGASVSGTWSLGSGATGVYNSGCSSHSGTSCLYPPKSREIRGILKSSSNPKSRDTTQERKKYQHWDEMNILATYHPPDKSYGHKKVDEPSTPYYRLPDSDEDLSPESSGPLTPEMLTERLATMDNFYPKVLRYGDNKKPESTDNFAKTYSSDFEKHRKAHYDEGKFFRASKNLPLDSKKSSESNVSVDSSNQVVMSQDSEPRSVEREWTGGLTRGVRDRGILAAKNHILKNKEISPKS